jgi:hypothetical protein
MTNLSTLFRQNVVGVQWIGINTDTTASTLSGYLINASSNTVTLTLPLTPTEGDVVGLCDAYNQTCKGSLLGYKKH